jgi:hypothetical protein
MVRRAGPMFGQQALGRSSFLLVMVVAVTASA